MEKLKVSDIANLLKVSQQTVYKKVKRLKKELANHSFKEKGILFFDFEGLEIIRASISTAPLETTIEAKPPQKVPVDFAPVISTFKDMEAGILALTQAFKSEMAALREDNQVLKNEVSRLQWEVSTMKNLLPPPAPIREKVITPEMQKPSAQRVLSFRQSVSLMIDNFCGFVFGD